MCKKSYKRFENANIYDIICLEVEKMPFKYNKLWKLLVDKGLNKSELCEKTGISRSTLNKLNGGENVNIEILEKICACLDCGIEDIVEYTKEKEVHQ